MDRYYQVGTTDTSDSPTGADNNSGATLLITRLLFGATGLYFLASLLLGFFSSRLGFNPWLHILYTAFALIAAYLLCGFIKRLTISARLTNILLIAALLVAGIAMLIVTNAMYYQPRWDQWAVVQGGYQLATMGTLDYFNQDAPVWTHFENVLLNFARFPQQWGGALLFGLIFKIAGIFSPEFSIHTASSIATILLTLVSVWFLFKIVVHRLGNNHAIFMLVITLTFIPFYAITAVYYTNVMSLPFGIGGLYFYDKWLETRRIRYIVAGALLFAFGALLIGNIAILVVAILFGFLFLQNLSLRSKLINIAIMLVTILVITQASSFFFNRQFDGQEHLFETMQTPLEVWVMVGMNEQSAGAVTQEDVDAYLLYPTMAERRVAARNELERRLDDMGVEGLVRHQHRKFVVNFMDGTFQITHFVFGVKNNPIVETLTRATTRDTLYQVLSSVQLIAMQLVIAVWLIKRALTDRLRVNNFDFVLVLSLFGLFLFLAIWESGSRLIVNFLPMLMYLFLSSLPIGVSPDSEDLPIAGKMRNIFLRQKEGANV